MTAHRERVERRRRAAEQRASFKATTVDVPAATTAPSAAREENAITITTVAAPKPAVKVDQILEPETIEGDAVVAADVPAGVEETESPASDEVAPVATTTTRNQSSKQTRTRRKR